MKNINIYVNSKCLVEPTLVYPENGKIPRDFIPEVVKHIHENERCDIVTVSDAIVNFIGAAIDDGDLRSDEVSLWLENELIVYDSEGCLINFPFGYFYAYPLTYKNCLNQ